MAAPTRVVAIGGADLVMGLGLLGIVGVRADDAAAAREALEQAVQDPGTALVLIDESHAAALGPALDASLQDAAGPLIVEIPGPGSLPSAEPLHERLERALGFKLRE